MVALLDKREAPSVQKILASIAEEYPQVCMCTNVFVYFGLCLFVCVFVGRQLCWKDHLSFHLSRCLYGWMY